jgi:hypothetical protein
MPEHSCPAYAIIASVLIQEFYRRPALCSIGR